MVELIKLAKMAGVMRRQIKLTLSGTPGDYIYQLCLLLGFLEFSLGIWIAVH